MRRGRRLLLLLLLPLAARAGDTYEEKQILRALAELGVEREPRPEGQVVEAVLMVRYEVFVADEPFPTLPNALHVVTTEATVRAELLLAPGQPYVRAKVEESERNLRDLKLFAVAAVLPIKGSVPGRVRLLVVTRDLWSLRLEWGLQFSEGRIDDLLLQVAERNLLGQNQRVLGRFRLDPLAWSAGAYFVDRRLMGQKLHLQPEADAFFRRADGRFEGMSARLAIARPFYDQDQATGFQIDGRVEDRVMRQVRGGAVLLWNDPAFDGDEAIPQVYRAEVLQTRAIYQRQWARGQVWQLTSGVGATRFQATPDEEVVLPRQNRPGFRALVMPQQRMRVYPLLAGSVSSNRFKTFTDLAAYGVSEDVRLGPSLRVNLEAPLAVLGSTANALEVEAAATFAGSPGAWLLEAAAAGEARFEGSEVLDQALVGRLRLATPRLVVGRLLLRGDWTWRAQNTTRTPLALGANNGLRGYPADHFFALTGQRLRFNTEYRSVPLVWSFLHLGGVLFYDAGSIYGQGRALDMQHVLGVGARVLFPQFYREVFRLDVGMPVEGGFLVRFTGGTGQAVPVLEREDVAFDRPIGGLPNQP